MMKNYISYKLIGLALIIVSIVACDTADQDVSPIISPDGKPVATFTTAFTGSSVAEGDIITYTITLDKMIDRSITFAIKSSGTADENDFSYEPVTLAPYTKEATFSFAIVKDNFPEVAETLNLEIGAFSIADRYLLNPTTVNPKLSLNITNVNRVGRFTVAFGWAATDDDYDCVMTSADNGDWGAAGTSDNPEICMDLWDSDDDGAYTFDIVPYTIASVKTDYTISIGLSDQSVQFFTGTFDNSKLADYTLDFFASWESDSYRLLDIVKTGSSYAVTHLGK